MMGHLTLHDGRIERIVRLASRITGCPAAVYVRDGEVAAAVGLSVPAFDAAALRPPAGQDVLVIEDLDAAPRGAALSRVGVRFVASVTVPVAGRADALVVLDRQARQAFDAGLDALQDLAALASEELGAPPASDLAELGIRVVDLQRAAADRRRQQAKTMQTLRSPITSIGLQVHLLASGRIDAAAQAKAVQSLKRNLDRFAGALDGLVDDPREGQAVVDLRGVVDGVLSGRRDDALRAGIRLHAPRDAPEVRVRAQASLQRAIDALVELALHDSAAGDAVGLELRRTELEAELIVQDASGMEPARAGKAFDAPSAASGDFTRAWIRHVASAHGGRAWAVSEGPGKGTRWHLALPLAP